jgi:hypothetical protein
LRKLKVRSIFINKEWKWKVGAKRSFAAHSHARLLQDYKSACLKGLDVIVRNNAFKTSIYSSTNTAVNPTSSSAKSWTCAWFLQQPNKFWFFIESVVHWTFLS